MIHNMDLFERLKLKYNQKIDPDCKQETKPVDTQGTAPPIQISHKDYTYTKKRLFSYMYQRT